MASNEAECKENERERERGSICRRKREAGLKREQKCLIVHQKDLYHNYRSTWAEMSKAAQARG